MFRALLYAYVLGGLTFLPLLIAAAVFFAIYTSVPLGDADVAKKTRGRLEADSAEAEKSADTDQPSLETNDTPRTRKGWLTMRRTFEESAGDGGYVTLVRSFLDARSKDPKKSRPKDMWYVVVKGKVLYLYEDEEMTECEAAVELSSYQVVIYPEGLPDAELFAKRNAICLKPKIGTSDTMPSVSKAMHLEKDSNNVKLDAAGATGGQREALLEAEKKKDAAREEALDPSTPWFIFVRSNTEMEDWYFSLIHASEQPAQTPTLSPLQAIFEAADMNHLVSTLDEQPDVIPMRWLNALIGRIFFSHYRTHNLEAYIIGRLMKKLSKVKRPAFLTEIAVTEVSVGNKAPMLSKPMLKELTKEGDASLEVHLSYKGEIRITVEATAVINLGARFKSYTVKLVLAAVLKELEGNLLIKVKRPPSNRIWYAFTQTPRMVLEVEPIVSDRQITWGMILSTIESKFKEIIQESVVMPNMDDIAFFETGSYEHRGGIWGDASRKPHLPTAVPTPIPDDVQSVASAPLPETSTLPSAEPALPTVSKSMDDVTTDLLASQAPATVDEPSTSSATLAEDLSDSLRNNARRRTWFSSVRSETSSLLSAPNFPTDGEQAEGPDEQRGRSVESEKSITPRSHSIPNKPESVRSTTLERIDPGKSEPSRSQTDLSNHNSSRRASSQHSVKVQPEEQDEGSSGLQQTKSTPNTPRKNSVASQIGRSPSPPSFFSTLKSKAADKQAISNTAKEAMRKWGVNWGGFKKDPNNASQNSDEPSQGGSSPPRAGLGSDNSNASAHKARASYAEVRAAVAERKEREKPSQSDDVSDSLAPSSPQAVRARVVSNPRGLLPNGSVYSETPINPSIVTSAARLTSTPRLNSKKSTPSMGRVDTEVDAQDASMTKEPVKNTPIHVQPVSKTMSIPGIHASHRGEVQSMGFVATPPPGPSGPSENMLKNPAIQTVYRLWKSPSVSAQDPPGDVPDISGPHAQHPIEETVLKETNGDAVAALAPAPNVHLPAPQPLMKPTPPPLPPRSTPITMSRPVYDTASDNPLPPTSASQVLKSLVLKDENIRTHPSVEPAAAGSTSEPTVRQSASPAVHSESSPSVLEANSDVSASTLTDLPQVNIPPSLPPRRPTQTPALLST
ncbi:hypothetical protein B0H34DRAFT_740125 [Crassisporium funariophilum]|nr:hypothetical protein B0H34DRAFT_740125 [Crassisporium funariophilum]